MDKNDIDVDDLPDIIFGRSDSDKPLFINEN